MTILSEVDEQATHGNGVVGGPSNPIAQHAYDGSVKTQGKSGVAFGATAVALVLIVASVPGLWLVRSVRRLNRQVAHLNRQTEQLNHRIQGAEQQVKSLDQKVSQAPPAELASLQPDRAPQMVDTEASSAKQAQLPVQSKAVAQPLSQVAQKTQDYRKQRDDELQNLRQSLGQMAETRRTAAGVVMALGEKSIRFDADKWNIAPQYRSILNRVAGVLMTLKGYSIYVYGYTDDAGTKDYNLQLSAHRARAVRDALVKAGIDPSLIRTKGFGKSKPRVRGTNAKIRATNRRIEIGVVDSTLISGNQPISQNQLANR
jgi:outer membrane protein OmpA-like peptidoglycan-associated protein